MGVQNSMFAFEFHGLLGVGDGGERSAKNVAPEVAVNVALGLLHFDELRLALIRVEQEDAGIFREAQPGGDFWKVGAFGFAVDVSFFVEGSGLGDGGNGAVLLVFFGGRPIYQRGGKFLPFVALGALVADAVAFDLIFGPADTSRLSGSDAWRDPAPES